MTCQVLDAFIAFAVAPVISQEFDHLGFVALVVNLLGWGLQDGNDIVFRLNEDIELPAFNVFCENDKLPSIFNLLELHVVITRQEKSKLLFVLLGIVH